MTGTSVGSWTEYVNFCFSDTHSKHFVSSPPQTSYNVCTPPILSWQCYLMLHLQFSLQIQTHVCRNLSSSHIYALGCTYTDQSKSSKRGPEYFFCHRRSKDFWFQLLIQFQGYRFFRQVLKLHCSTHLVVTSGHTVKLRP